MISPLNEFLRIADSGGQIAREFHRWLQQLALAATTEQSPVIGDMAPGSFVIEDGQFGIHVKRLTLSGNERAAIAGSGRLVICG